MKREKILFKHLNVDIYSCVSNSVCELICLKVFPFKSRINAKSDKKLFLIL